MGNWSGLALLGAALSVLAAQPALADGGLEYARIGHWTIEHAGTGPNCAAIESRDGQTVRIEGPAEETATLTEAQLERFVSDGPDGERALLALRRCARLAAASPGHVIADCPDDQPRLPLTGLCQGRALALLNEAPGDAPLLLEGCRWVVNETPFAEDVLLYLAARCRNRTARLGYEAGARKAVLKVEASVFVDEAGWEIAHVFGADPDDPGAVILSQVRFDVGSLGTCHIVQPDYFPGGSVVDVSAAEAAKAPKDEPRTACGFYGLDEDTANFWRVFQGFSWFFMLGQDAYQDVDARTFTLVTEDGQGGWSVMR